MQNGLEAAIVEAKNDAHALRGENERLHQDLQITRRQMEEHEATVDRLTQMNYQLRTIATTNESQAAMVEEMEIMRNRFKIIIEIPILTLKS